MNQMDNLSRLAKKFQTDKYGHHYYTPIYDKYLSPLTNKEITLVEAGIGGYHTDAGGASLRMWKEYFPKGQIVGFDIYDKKQHEEERIKILQGSQNDMTFLMSMFKEIGSPDVIIDDASHLCPLTLDFFRMSFPYLKSGGFFFIEDVHTSYWAEAASDGVHFGGGDHPNSTTNYFKRMVDVLNLEHCQGRGYNLPESPSYFSNHIESIHFYKELIVILKK